MVYEKALNIYTDGSSLPAPRRGAANNEMELLACITALQHAAEHGRINEFERVVIFTDSLYVKDNVPRALFQWPKRKWLSQEGRPIENATLWKDLVRAIKKTPPAS